MGKVKKKKGGKIKKAGKTIKSAIGGLIGGGGGKGGGKGGGRRKRKGAQYYAREIVRFKLKKKLERLKLGVGK